MQVGTSPGPTGGERPVDADQVRGQLSRILKSDQFASSQRMCRFLSFLVERALEQDTERLKEFVVALEVFDRKDDYDSSIDSIVRVEARRLRGKLKAYYEGPGASDPVLIGLRPGSYVPIFRALAAPAEEEAVPGPPPAAVHNGPCTIAVLPFVNMSPEPEQDYFCDGITEEILNTLASIENLAVVSRTSTFRFKGQPLDVREIAEKLNAQVVVEGSVRKAGTQLRISAQAVDAARGLQLWSETYRRELNDIFAIQEEVSRAIANALPEKLPVRGGRKAGAKEPSLDAYTGYFRALHLVHQLSVPGLFAAIAQFGELTRRYPEYADPYAGVATTLGMLSLFGIVAGREVEAELKRNAEQAVRLNPESADGWTVMAGISAHWEFDWAEALRRFRKAIALQPSSFMAHSWHGMVLTMLGRWDEAETELTQAIKLNPLGASGYARRGFFSYLRGEDAEAVTHLSTALQLEPDFPEARMVLGFLRIRQGDWDGAEGALSRNLDVMPRPINIGLLAGVLHRKGRPQEAQAMLGRLDAISKTQYVTPLAKAMAFTGMNEPDLAFEALASAVQDRTIFVNLTGVNPYFDCLRRDSRFAKLLKSMGLESLAGFAAAR